MAHNVLPLFWNLASSSKDVRLTASADLVSSLEGFQDAFIASQGDKSPGSDDEEDDDGDELDGGASRTVNGKKGRDMDEDDKKEESESDEESGVEVDASDEEDGDDGEGVELDKALAKKNAEDVVYTVKRLVRGLASSRESSRLGFAVALTELLNRMPSITAPQVLSLLVRNSPISKGMKGSEERDMLFARLFGLTVVVQSSALFSAESSISDFDTVLDRLAELGKAKGWLRESAWWGILQAVEMLFASQAAWKEEAVEGLVRRIKEEKNWNQEKIALVLLLERERPTLDWKSVLSPTFKHSPLLASHNLVALARILKETDVEGDDSGSASSSTGSWKPQLHFVWTMILDIYFGPSSDSASDRAPFQDFFRTIVDESLFANTSSPQRRFWGFSVFSRALPLVDDAQVPLLFTPNFMRCWMNNLSSPDRYLHKAALGIAKSVQDVVKQNPKVGFTLLSTLVGKNGRQDFDKVTKTKTVESIMGSLNGKGVGEYATYLQGLVLATDEQNGVDLKAIENRRQWALDQMLSLSRNTSVPKEDVWISSVLEFLIVHGFFVIRKVDKKSPITALRVAAKPALSEATAATCRARFFSFLVEITTASTSQREPSAQPPRPQGCDASGKLWLRRMLDVIITLTADSKHLEAMMDADEEIKGSRKAALTTLQSLKNVTGNQAELARGGEILLSFIVLQTYDENEDALDMLEDVNGAIQRLFVLSKGAKESIEDPPAIDLLLDVLIALLDKGSSDLRNLAKVVMGMLSAAFTQTSIQHLVAQLEGSAAEAAAAEMEEEEDQQSHLDDAHDDVADENETDEDEDEEGESSGDDDDDEDEDDGMTPVDPAFRQRVTDALRVAGMAVDEDAEEEGDEDPESEVWDDEQMLKVDEQLAEVFRQQAGRTRQVDLKHLQIESLHFKNRILDFFDVFARKQSTNTLVIDIILPLLRLVRASGTSEADLANKASGILRTRLGKAKEIPSLIDLSHATSILSEVHIMARKAASSDFSALCSACSLFLSRAIESAHPTSTVVVDSYRETLEDLMTRKASLVHPSFILDLLRRFPVRAWPLRVNLITHLAPGKGVNVYRQVQAYGMLQVLAQQLPAVAKSVSGIEVESFVSSASKAVYATLGHAASDCRAEWKADRLKDVCKFALALARSSKSVLGDDKALSTWDMTKLQPAQEALVKGERTEGMKGVIGLVGQVFSTLGGSTGKTARAGKRKKAAEMGGAEDDKMDVDEPAAIAASNDAGEEVKKLKQAKTGEKKAAAEKESAVKTKRSKVKEGGKPSKKVNALS